MASTLPEPVARLVAAANSGDSQGFLDTFAPEGTVDDRGRVFSGREEIQEWSDAEFIGMHVTLDVTAEITTGEYTTFTATVGGEGFTGESHFSFTVEDDLVQQMTITA
ncbi:nuclear transport factor 2 family protein [Mycetocola sp.]|uniref:nuclear transport factor 2 family protein n=1 Tax=Mycetocola sp. TaxID=1871042 RepID=UPI003989127A